MATRKPRTKKTDIVPAPQTVGQEGELIVIVAPTPEQISTARRLAESETRPTLDSALNFTVTSHAQYTDADHWLGKIRDARKLIEDRFEPIIRPLYLGLESIYAMRRALDDLFNNAEVYVKRRMGEYQLEEHKRLLAEREENDRKAKEIADRLAEEARLKAAEETELAEVLDNPGAQTPAAPSTLVAVTYLGPPSAPAPRGAHSRSRIVQKWRITNREQALDGILAGLIPADVFTINAAYVDNTMKLNPDAIASWPGFEVYDDAQISGR